MFFICLYIYACLYVSIYVHMFIHVLPASGIHFSPVRRIDSWILLMSCCGASRVFLLWSAFCYSFSFVTPDMFYNVYLFRNYVYICLYMFVCFFIIMFERRGATTRGNDAHTGRLGCSSTSAWFWSSMVAQRYIRGPLRLSKEVDITQSAPPFAQIETLNIIVRKRSEITSGVKGPSSLKHPWNLNAPNGLSTTTPLIYYHVFIFG